MCNSQRLVSSDEAVPATRQHRSPCGDCPWARTALPGWLGGADVAEWLDRAHSETVVDCHTFSGGVQCAGLAIYRANVLKKPRHPAILVLPVDRDKVFATPMQFKEHHEHGRPADTECSGGYRR